jgi:hypothetical protein
MTIPALGTTSAFNGAGVTIRAFGPVENGPKKQKKKRW